VTKSGSGLPRNDEVLLRCSWAGTDPLYVQYHDREWGVPQRDDRALFEMLVLEGFQAGLSWITILRKRENFRRAFDGFDPAKMARYTDRKVERLLADAGIIRHRGKIESSILSARAWLKVMEEGPGFAPLVWGFVGGKPLVNRRRDPGDVPARTELSNALSKELSRRGFRFCGPTTTYAFMQATGLVNDHLVSCHRYRALA
jgi:DNA-3-methyladenine glycosylase I